MSITLYPCPCCGFLAFDRHPGTYEFCPVCVWQDDLAQLKFPTLRIGPNKASLIEAQLNYSEHGVSTIKRQPSAPSSVGFERDENWRPIDLKMNNIELTSVGDQGNTYPQDRTTLYYWRPAYWRRLP